MIPAEPEPSGRRRTPPPALRAAVAAGAESSRLAVLNLLDLEEARVIERRLCDLGWRVLVADEMLDLIAVALESPVLVVSDDPSLNRSSPDLWEGSAPLFVVLVDDRESAIEGAWRSGADWVITRPLNSGDLWQLSS